MAKATHLDYLVSQRPPSATEQVFGSIHKQILTCALPPGTKMSEVVVAKRMGTSRQPVRDAFFRLSQLGFLLIRPQRATIVCPISSAAVLQAMYIRRALEVEVVSDASSSIDNKGLDQLARLISEQEGAIKTGDPILFHLLDDEFHKTICEAADNGFVWELIKQKKAHMDRIRCLSVSSRAKPTLDEHEAVLQALKARDKSKAVAAMRKHLTRIEQELPRIQKEHQHYFEQEEA